MERIGLSPTRRQVLLAGAGIAGAAGAQPRGGPPSYEVMTDPPRTHDLSLRDVTLDGIGYRLFRARPWGRVDAVLWMLDGNAVFDRLGAEQLAAAPHVAVIGLGYQVESLFAGPARALDYTPATPGDRGDPRHPERATGGADAFRARLRGPLAEAAGISAPGVLWGHSYGGLFALTTLLTAPETFAGYVAVSPSLWFGGGVAGEMARSARAPAHPVPLHLLLGDMEGRPGAPVESPQADAATLDLADRLAARANIETELTILAGLRHGETFTASFDAAFAMAAGLR